MLTVVLVVLLILLLVGGAGYRYPTWGATGWGAPDLLGVLLIVVLVLLLLRGL